MGVVRLEGVPVRPATVEGSPDVFQSPKFVLVKPIWAPDENFPFCELCETKFTQFKRRHHCRMCGAVRCAKCCSQKLSLPQIGIEEPERVCESCRTVAELIAKARSHSQALLLESANGLASFAKHQKHLSKMIELGGLQTLVTLTSIDNERILSCVMSGLHSLCTHDPLQQLLVESGTIKGICKILSTTQDRNEQIAIDGLTSLMILCKNVTFRSKAICDGCLQVNLSMCWSENETVSLLAISTLCLLAEQPETVQALFGSQNNAIARFLQLTVSSDFQLQEVVLKLLAHLTAKDASCRHQLILEDLSSGRSVLRVFNNPSANKQVVSNAACLIANMATSVEDQGGLQDALFATINKLRSSGEDQTSDLLFHIIRAMANFAQHEDNTTILLETIPDVVRFCLACPSKFVELQALRFLLTLLAHAPAKVSFSLIGESAQLFLTSLGNQPYFLSAIQANLAKDAPSILAPP